MTVDRNRFGKASVMRGRTALDLVENAVGDTVRPGSPVHQNMFGRSLVECSDELASAVGLVTAGCRTSVTLDAGDAIESITTIQESVRRRLPLVIHLTSSDEARIELVCRAAETTGCVVLVASSVQALIDLTVIGHHVAESSLVPTIIVAGDTLDGIENVSIPAVPVLQSYLGPSDDRIDASTPSQRLTFGKYRRRVPNWIHPDVPVLHGVIHDGRTRDFEILAHEEFVQSHLFDIITAAFNDYAKLTGWPVASVRTSGWENADAVIVTWGAAFERLANGADAVRKKGVRIGVMDVGLRRPFPDAVLCQWLSEKKSVTIVEPNSSSGELYGRVSAVLNKAVQNSVEKKTPPYPELPAIKRRPMVYRVQHAGTLTTADVLGIFDNIRSGGRRDLIVGVAVAHSSSRYPKQQVLFQTIRQDYADTVQKTARQRTDTHSTGEATLTVRWAFGHRGTDMSEFEKLATWAKRRWNVHVKGKAVAQSGWLEFSRSPGTLQPDSCDVFLVDDLPAGSLRFVRKGGRVILFGGSNTSRAPSLRMLREKQIRLETLDSTDVLFPFMGLVSRLCAERYGDPLDVEREMAAIVNYARDEWNYDLDETQRDVLRRSLTDFAIADVVPGSAHSADELPMAVRRYADHGPSYSRVSQFYDRAGFFYRAGQHEEITADPFYSIPVLPLSTSNVIGPPKTATIPSFSPASCTGCGACYVHCPHSAIPPLLISVEAVLKSAVDRLASRGSTVRQFTPPVLKSLSRAVQQAFNSDPAPATFGCAMETAVEKTVPALQLSSDAEASLRNEIAQVKSVVQELPTAVTQKFWRDAERHQKGSGMLFSLAINPQACTGCGICARVCADHAILMTESDESIPSVFRLWESLPDTPGDAIQKWIQDDGTDPFAALLLSRNYYQTLSGGGASDSESERVVIHLVTAVTESMAQSHVLKWTASIERLIADLSAKLQGKLAGAIPFQHLEKLAAGLAGKDKTRMALDELISEIDTNKPMIDTVWVERTAGLITELRNLLGMLREGPTGVGRSRLTAIIGKTMDWAKTFPHNPMTHSAVVWDDGESSDFVLGVCRGHVRQVMDNVRLVRRAELETKDQYDPIIHDDLLSRLTWTDLTEEEKSWIPPVLWITGPDILSESRLTSFFSVVSSDLPVKVIILNPADGSREEMLAQSTTLWSLMASGRIGFVQSSPADSQHLFNGIADAMRHPHPAVLHLAAPAGPSDDWITRWKLSYHSRAFPFIRFQPGQKHLALNLDLDGNPNIEQDFSSLSNDPAVVTYADWAYSSPRWKSKFQKVDSSTSVCTVSNFLELDPEARSQKVPVITVGRDVFEVPDEIIEACETVRSQWRLVREMAGLLSPHPVRLKASIEEEWTKKQAAALEKARDEYERKLREQEQTQVNVMKEKIREKLMQLAGYTK